MKNVELINKVIFPCYFDPEVKERAIKLSIKKSTPLAHVIRKLVDKWLEENETNETNEK